MQTATSTSLERSSPLQRDIERVVGTNDHLYDSTIKQLSSSNPDHEPTDNPDEDAQSDELISVLGRMNIGRFDNQRASVPEMVSQGVVPMGWRLRRSTELDPADLELFDRLERASARRFSNQCSPTPKSLETKPSTPFASYLESMRETEAMQSLITNSSLTSETSSSQKSHRASVSTTRTRTESEGSEHNQILSQHQSQKTPSPSIVKKSRAHSAPNIFSFRRKSSTTQKLTGSSKSPKSSIRRVLFGKGV